MLGAVKIRGQAELEKAFLQLRKDVLVGLKPAIIEAAEPVRRDAERLSVDHISHIGSQWSRMRIGVSVTGVYIAPASRRRRGTPRPNLAPLLLTQMEDALDQNGETILRRVDGLVTASAARSGFY